MDDKHVGPDAAHVELVRIEIDRDGTPCARHQEATNCNRTVFSLLHHSSPISILVFLVGF